MTKVHCNCSIAHHIVILYPLGAEHGHRLATQPLEYTEGHPEEAGAGFTYRVPTVPGEVPCTFVCTGLPPEILNLLHLKQQQIKKNVN